MPETIGEDIRVSLISLFWTQLQIDVHQVLSTVQLKVVETEIEYFQNHLATNLPIISRVGKRNNLTVIALYLLKSSCNC